MFTKLQTRFFIKSSQIGLNVCAITVCISLFATAFLGDLKFFHSIYVFWLCVEYFATQPSHLF